MAVGKHLDPDNLLGDVDLAKEDKEVAVKAPVAEQAKREGRTHRDYIQHLRNRIEELEAERSADGDGLSLKKISPTVIRHSKYSNRIEISFTDPAFQELRESIRITQGNEVPISVRPLGEPEGDYLYEVVYGHRRHQACLLEGVDVTARVAPVTDRQMIFHMVLENLRRADLSLYEEGKQFKELIEAGLYARQTDLVNDLGLSPSFVSERLKVASLPEKLIQAIGDPRHLGIGQARNLFTALKKNEAEVMRRAEQLIDQNGSDLRVESAAAVKERVHWLIEGDRDTEKAPRSRAEEYYSSTGRRLFSKRMEKNRLNLVLDRNIPAEIQDEVIEHLQDYLDKKLT